MINRNRRAEIRQEIGDWPHDYEVDLDELHTLLDYADERDEAVALLWECRNRTLPMVERSLCESIDALLRRVGGSHE